ncbi:MAG TPA: fibronectin type III domain-containing protein, partial [Candidatus Dojkabacteria bacterium]|nr:fibronectin type III domain-containing protein [Candidatus Dojkabacteria bacterium]
MKLKTALTTLFLFLLSFLFVDTIFAQFFYPPSTSGDVVVSASINVDLYSQLSLSPSTVEAGQPSTVSITSLLPDGSARSGREIIIYIDGNPTGVSIVQPPLTNSQGKTTGSVSSVIAGTYKVCAKDVTEGLEIFIADCETLYVVPVPAPQMLPEPEYTKGDSNIVMWHMVGSGVYEYYVEVSTTSDFSTVLDNSDWINNLAYEFDNLKDGQIYFYRVKARNSYGVEGGWSNVVFSVQDDEGPQIEYIGISDMEENTNVDWDRDFEVNIRYRITDNVAIASKDFWCLANDGSRYDCLYTTRENGDFWDITVQLKYLEKTASGNLFEEYRFCAEATDSVNNVTRNCEAKLEVTIEVPEEEIPKPTIPSIITRIIDRLDKFFEEAFLKLKQAPLENITVVTTAINLVIGFGFLIATLGSIPYILLQLFLSILTLLGLRKKSNVSGYVYNSLTKEPIKQAIVRVFNEVHELIWTSVTDSNGYFMAPEVED